MIQLHVWTDFRIICLPAVSKICFYSDDMNLERLAFRQARFLVFKEDDCKQLIYISHVFAII